MFGEGNNLQKLINRPRRKDFELKYKVVLSYVEITREDSEVMQEVAITGKITYPHA